jgi:uncharacterized SAM-binding protein YcdF (DUF218 family)
VETESPRKADAVLVLAGDYRGARVTRAAELVKAGYAPKVLVSGPTEMYGVNEAALAIQYAVTRGALAGYFEPVHIQALSTLEEALAIASELRKRNIHTLLLVTSNYHTRRAAETFRRVLGTDIQIVPIAAEDIYFRPDAWWHNREGQKTVFYEYSKTIASWLGM